MDSTKTDSYQTPKSCFILSRIQRIRWACHHNFRMARHTTGVSTRSIRFVSIHDHPSNRYRYRHGCPFKFDLEYNSEFCISVIAMMTLLDATYFEAWIVRIYRSRWWIHRSRCLEMSTMLKIDAVSVCSVHINLLQIALVRWYKNP